ncbi:MAG TPA: class II fumarate hydratase [Candidatus Dormibacteraeota bacterium]
MATRAEQDYRVEKDSMGEMRVPAGAYYGASSERARQNFPISGRGFPRQFISALGLIKKSAAEVNRELGLLSAEHSAAIVQAAQEVVDGKLDAHFVIDVYQTGSGTSTNTNANEVIANRASEIMGGPIGPGRLIHPNDQVNLCQSSNDVIPSALQVAVALEIHAVLRPGLERLRGALAAKSEEFWPLVKTGRTHLQDATPVRLGQEFLGYAGQLEESQRRGKQALDELLSLPIGGTAVGTGINAHPEFGARAAAKLAEATGLKFHETSNHFHAQATLDALVAAHGLLRTIGVSLWKIASDIRLMGMGPTAGLFELRLPETQPGSSIMPGKVNPVIVESLTMAVARVLGNDVTVTLAGQSGSFFELNVMMPVAAVTALESVTLLGNSAANFAERCVEGLEATDRGPALLEKNPILATALNPLIGYDESAKIAKEAFKTGRTIRELARERGLSDEQIDSVLDPGAMTKPGLEGPGGGG